MGGEITQFKDTEHESIVALRQRVWVLEQVIRTELGEDYLKRVQQKDCAY